ncbi:hypothetical protein EPN44_04975 [bacterium]|nr:MAG: hypothetical protein EPN44_04975 [bacterium]
MRIHLAIAAALAFAVTSLTPVFAAPPEKIGLMGLNNSGEVGTVTLAARGSKTEVSLSVQGGPKGVAQPAHVHRGSCDNLNPNPAFALSNVVSGRSNTLVNASLSKLMSGNFAVNVHASTKNLKRYVACGELVR